MLRMNLAVSTKLLIHRADIKVTPSFLLNIRCLGLILFWNLHHVEVDIVSALGPW